MKIMQKLYPVSINIVTLVAFREFIMVDSFNIILTSKIMVQKK